MFYSGIGRLLPGVEPDSARAPLQAIVTRASSSRGAGSTPLIYVDDLCEYYTGHNWRQLYFFLGASLAVPLLSLVNVATLVLVRAVGRMREFALRGALGGASRVVARQLPVEGGLLAIAGAMFGVLIALWGVEFFTAQLPVEFLLRGDSIPVDIRVLAFVIAVTGLITGGLVLTPLLPLRRFDLSSYLSAGVRSGIPAAEGRMRGVLLDDADRSHTGAAVRIRDFPQELSRA